MSTPTVHRKRDKHIVVCMTEAERQQLQELADLDDEGCYARTIRQLVRVAYAAALENGELPQAEGGAA